MDDHRSRAVLCISPLGWRVRKSWRSTRHSNTEAIKPDDAGQSRSAPRRQRLGVRGRPSLSNDPGFVQLRFEPHLWAPGCAPRSDVGVGARTSSGSIYGRPRWQHLSPARNAQEPGFVDERLWRLGYRDATVPLSPRPPLVSCSTPFQTVNPLIPRSWVSLGRSGGFFFTSRTVARATSPFLQGREPGEVT